MFQIPSTSQANQLSAYCDCSLRLLLFLTISPLILSPSHLLKTQTQRTQWDSQRFTKKIKHEDVAWRIGLASSIQHPVSNIQYLASGI